MKVMLDEKQYPSASTGLETVRLGYCCYGSRSYRLLVMNCIGNFAHYNTLDIIFDIPTRRFSNWFEFMTLWGKSCLGPTSRPQRTRIYHRLLARRPLLPVNTCVASNP
jgi:hypothetical protein